MRRTECAVPDCHEPIRCKALCEIHYSRMLRTGRTDLRHRPTPEQRFMAKVAPDPATGCWNWTGTKNPAGYGKFGVSQPRRNVYAHRWSWEHFNGNPIPDGLHIDHLCRNRACVNPDHLEPVTQRENTHRGASPSIVASMTKRCMAGHDMTDPSNVLDRARPVCVKCKEAATARRMAERERGERPHGTTNGYTDGCRCAECRAAHAEYARAHRKKKARR